MRARPRELEQVVDRRPQDAAYGVVGQRRLGEHGLAVAALEVLERRLLVAAHVRLQHDALDRHGRALAHVGHVQDVGVARHHVRADGVTGRPAPEHVAHRADDVRLHLAEARTLGDGGIVDAVEECAQLHDLGLDPLGERQRVPADVQTKQDALVIRSWRT